jgi:hypothetical protein
VKDKAKNKALSSLKEMQIDALSFNQYPAYLLHSETLKEIEISKEIAEVQLPKCYLRSMGYI